MASYSNFLLGIQAGLIDKVRVLPNGRSADYLGPNNMRGNVELLNDPGFLDFIKKFNVDLYVMNPGNSEA